MVFGLGWILRDERGEAEEMWRGRLSAMADDREAAIEGWIEGLLDHARSVAAFPSVLAAVDESDRAGGRRPDDHVASVLASVCESGSLLGISVLDSSLSPLGEVGLPLPEEARVKTLAAFARKELGALTLLVRSGEDQRPVLVFLVPVMSRVGGGASGRVALLVDPSRWLYPLLRREPTPTRTSETLLVRWDGSDIVFFSPLRFRRDPPGTYRIPGDSPRLASRAALLAERGTGAFLDYRGVPVLAATRRLATTRWGLVVKVDREEVLAEVGTKALERGGSLVALLLAVAGFGFGAWREQRSRAEASSKEQYATLQAILESADAPIYSVDRALHYTSFNSAHAALMRSLHGYQPALGRSCVDPVPSPADRERLRASLEATVLSGRQVVEEVRNEWRGGSFFEVSRNPIRDPDGTPVGAAVFAKDVTVRKRSEEELLRLNERFTLAAQAASVGIWDWDVVTQLVVWDDRMYELYGLERKGDVDVGDAWVRALHPDDAEHAKREVRRALDGDGDYRAEYRVLTPGGAVRFLKTFGRVVRGADGKAQRMIGGTFDVTEQRLAEEARRVSETRYRALFEDNPMPMWAYDLESLRIVTVNRAAAELYGYTTSELLSLTLGDLRSPEEFERLEAFIEDMVPGRQYAGTWKHRRKDGQILDVDVHLDDVELDGRKLKLSVLHDVTQQRRLEEQFRQAQKMEAVGRLAGGVAHDFNNLLTVILGYGEFLLSGMSAEAAERDFVEEIVAAGRRASALTRQLLAFSRKQILEPRVLDLAVVVADLKKMLSRLIGEDVDLVTLAGPGLGRVLADRGQIEQILMNLAVNARDAMPAGGTLTIETRDVDLDEAGARGDVDLKPGRYVMLAVSDTGTGMDEATMAKIFEPFFTTKEKGKGTGLGLSTVYGIVDQSGGSIRVESAVGRGTTFRIYLPLTEEPVPQKKTSAASGRFAALEPQTVLLVEDDEALRRLARDLLVANGFTVLVATDPADALTLAKRYPGPIHLVLSDVVMPACNGPELLPRLRTLRPDLRVVFMSGYSDEAITRHGVLEEGAPFLQKPFTASALLAKVREALSA